MTIVMGATRKMRVMKATKVVTLKLTAIVTSNYKLGV
jgi:hypothetical protein